MVPVCGAALGVGCSHGLRCGNREAVHCDRSSENQKKFLELPEKVLEGLAKALWFQLYVNINEDEIPNKGNSLIDRKLTYRVQAERGRKEMTFHPRKSVEIYDSRVYWPKM